MNKTSYTLSMVVIPNIISNHVSVQTLIPLFFSTYETILSTQHTSKNAYAQQFVTNLDMICRDYKTDLQSIIEKHNDKINIECLEVIMDHYQVYIRHPKSIQHIIAILLNSTNTTISLVRKMSFIFNLDIKYSCLFKFPSKEINNFPAFVYLYDNNLKFRSYVKRNKDKIYSFIAPKNNDLTLLKWLIERFDISRYDRDIHIEACKTAAENRNLKVFEYINYKFQLNRTEMLRYESNIFAGVARRGHLDILQWLTDKFGLGEQDVVINYNKYEFQKAFQDAAENGHLHVLIWMTDKFNLMEQQCVKIFDRHKYMFMHIAENGYLDVLQWLTDKFNLTAEDARTWDTRAFSFAAENGHLHVLQWMTDRFNLDIRDVRKNVNYAFRHAAKNGHLHVLQWLTDRFNLTAEDARSYNNGAFRYAVKNGHLDVVQWLTDRFNSNIHTTSNNNYAFPYYYVGNDNRLNFFNGNYTLFGV